MAIFRRGIKAVYVGDVGDVGDVDDADHAAFPALICAFNASSKRIIATRA